MPDRVHGPTEAYYEVATWLRRLYGDEFFLRPLAMRGTELTIIGRDNIETRWLLEPMVASRLDDWVHAQTGLAVVNRQRFPKAAA